MAKQGIFQSMTKRKFIPIMMKLTINERRL